MNRLETIAKEEREMRIPAVLSQKVLRPARQQRPAHRRPPVLTPSRGELALGVQAVTVLAHGALEGGASVWIDCVRGPGNDRPRQATIGRETGDRPPLRHRLARITARDQPLAGLALQL